MPVLLESVQYEQITSGFSDKDSFMAYVLVYAHRRSRIILGFLHYTLNIITKQSLLETILTMTIRWNRALYWPAGNDCR